MKRWLRASVALLALIAMLSENTYSVYAAMDGYTSPDGSVQEFEQEIEVDTKEAETPTQAVDDPAESADEVEAAVADEADDPEEAAEEDDTEVRNTGRRSAGVVSASVEAFDDYLAAEGVDDFTLYINTDEMNDDDKFSLEFTEDAVPFMDDVLFGTMTKEDGGIYNISDLDGEYFEIWVDSVSDGMEVKYEIRDDDYPQITLVSEPEPEVEKSLEVDGNVVYGEGYRELHIDIDTEELPDDTYYALHIDTDADVEYEGEALSGNVIETISNTTEEIYLSNLDKEYFELYITGENTDEVGAAYYVDSVENGALRISLNMDGTSGEGSAKITDVKATIVDQFGDEIGEDYTDMDLPEFEDDVLTLDDPEKAPVENVEIEAGPAKVIKYTYEESKLDKKVITALKREEVTDAKTGETGYAYSFTEDGQTWKPIREDTTVYFSYSDGKKSVYEYEDGDISVKATLQHANAIPDDAEFVVTRITPETEGYNYEAYMQAANENAALIDKEYDPESEGERFTADNSMLYDIAFVYTDEEGNKVEYQPAEGAVKIEIGFKKNQMEEDLGIENAEDIAIVHMPLSDSVKEETATTAEATDISASDISVEVVDNQARGEEELAFNLSDFSTVFLANISGLKKGTDRDFEGVLGDARFYGVTANTVQKVVHMDTNFATKYLKGLNGDITAGAYTGVNGGAYIIADSDNGSLQINGKAVKIKTTNAVKNRIQKSSDSVWDINEKSYWEGIVNGMISYVTAQSKTINDSENTYAYSTLLNDKLIDITSKGAGTYYIQADNIQGQQPMFERLGGELRIKKNSNQTIVFVFTKEDVHIHRYQIQNADKSTEWISSATQNETIDPIVRTVIFNMYNAKNLYFEAGTAGTFLAPQATVQSLNGTSSGWIVCNYFKNTSGEWHCVYQDMPDELATETVIKGYKYVNNTTPKSNEKFWFDLYAYGNQPDGTPNGTLIASAQNNGELIQFPAIKYDKYYGGNPDVYGYKIVERADANNGYEEDKAIYIVKHNVTKVGNQITATVRYIADKTDGTEKQLGTDYNKIKFYNFTGTPYDFPVKKLFYKNDGTNWNAKDYKDWLNDWLRKNGIGYGEDWPDGATFTFRMEKFDGGQANAGNNIKMGPLPAATKVEGADYCEITLTKNNQTGTFGTVNFPLKAYDDGALTQYYRTPDGVEVWNRTYMYKIYEVVPDDAHKVPGVTYSDKVIYLKIFVDCMKNSLGQYTMNVHDKISLSNTNGSCYDNPGPAEFVNHYQGGSLTVQKIAKDKAGNPVDGDKDFYVVVYRKEGNKKIYYGTNGQDYNSVHVEKVKGNTSLTFYGLQVDKQYYVFETDANGNVIADSDDYTVTYEGVDVQNKLNLTKKENSKTAKVINTQVDKGILELTKMGGLASESPFKLQGVTFRLYKKEGDKPVYATGSNGVYAAADASTPGKVQDLVTDANGSLKVTGLPVGEYYVQEQSLPNEYKEGLIAYTDPIYFNVTRTGTAFVGQNTNYVQASASGATIKLTVYNERRPALIKVKKDIISGRQSGSKVNDDPSGYEFTLTDKTTGQTVGTATTGKDGMAYFAGDLIFGHEYEVSENESVAASKGTILKSFSPTTFKVDDSWYQNADIVKIADVMYVYRNQAVAINQEVTGKVTLIKKDADGNTIPESEGVAKFVVSTSNNVKDTAKYVHVSGSAGSYKYDIKSSETLMETKDGQLLVEELAPGTYYFFEKESPDASKYTFDPELPYEFKIDATQTKVPVVEVTREIPNGSFHASLSFSKVNAYNIGKKLTDKTEFTLYETASLGGAVKGDALVTVSATEGTVRVPFVKAGTYVLVETKTEDGYESEYEGKPLSIYLEVESTDDKNENLTLADVAAYATQNGRSITKDELVDPASNHVKNEPKTGKVTLEKRFLDKDGKPIQPTSPQAYLLGEANFTLYTNSPEFKKRDRRYSNHINDLTKFVEYGKYTTTGQKLTVEDLPWGDYYFEETGTAMQDGKEVFIFDKNNHYSFTIGEGQDGRLLLDINKFTDQANNYVDNTIKTGNVKIVKKDADTDEGIAGIKFELHRVVSSADGSTYTDLGKVAISPNTTASDGSLEVKGLEFGEYYFVESPKEEQTVTGYEFDTETKYFFDITGEEETVTGLSYILNGEQKTSPKGYITNKPNKGSVTLDKYAIVKGTAANPEYLGALDGAEFTLYYNGETTIWQQIVAGVTNLFTSTETVYRPYQGNGKYVTSGGGKIYVGDLPWGSYYFEETKAPAGYKLPDDPKYYFVISPQKLNVHIGKPEGDVLNDEVSGKIPVNEQLNGSLKLTKTDSETKKGIAGVAFRLYKDGEDYTAKLDAARNKTNKSNYKFRDGSEEMLLITDENGVITVEELPWGVYTFKEAEVPEGYTAIKVDSDALTISASNVHEEAVYDATNTTELDNTPIKGDLLLYKKSDKNEPLPGATFDLVRVDSDGYHKVNVTGNNGVYTYAGVESRDYRADSIGKSITEFLGKIFNTKSGDLVLDASAKLTVSELPFGDYEIYEITPPDGYEPPASDTPAIIRTFKIDGNKNEDGHDATVTFINSKIFAGVQFVKAAQGEELAGATFVLERQTAEDAWEEVMVASSAAGPYYAIRDTKNTVVANLASVVSFSGLQVGNYRIYEVSDAVKAPEAANNYAYLNADGKEIWSAPDENTKYYQFKITAADSGINNVGLDNPDGSFGNYDAQKVENTPKPGKAKLLKREGTTAVEGAVFELHRSSRKNGNYVLGKPSQDALLDTITSNAQGEVITDELEWGDYYLVEKETSDDSYFLEKNIDDRIQYHFTIGKDTSNKIDRIVTFFTALQKGKDAVDATIAPNDKIYGKAEFTKKDADTLGLIKSEKIKFDLYYKKYKEADYEPVLRYSGDKALNAKDGFIRTAKDLEVGYYYFIETSTADGYVLPPLEQRTKYEFTITQPDDATSAQDYQITWSGEMAHTDASKPEYYVTNTPKPGSVKLKKVFTLEGDVKKPLSGAKFTLEGTTKAGKPYKSEVLSTDQSGEVTFSNIPWGTYAVTEVVPPAGYKLPDGLTLPSNIIIDDKKLDHTFETDASLEIVNERKPGQLKLKKVDNKGNALAGVAFELQKKNETTGAWEKISNPENGETGYYVTGEGGFLSLLNLVTAKGEIVIKGLKWGNYRLIEREVPEGIMMMDGYVGGENGVYVGAENMDNETALEYDFGEVENANIHGNIGLKKISDKSNKGLGGAEFVLYQATAEKHFGKPVYVKKTAEGVYAYSTMDASKAAAEDTLTLVSPGDASGNPGQIKVTGLPCGTYYMQETKAPDPTTDDAGNTIIYQINTAEIGDFNVTVDQAAEDEPQDTNFLTWVNGSENFSADVLFYKKDAHDQGLNGVVYEVWAKGSNGSSWKVTSGPDGTSNGVVKIHFVATGVYSIKEFSTPDDAYELDPNTYDIQLRTADKGKTINLSDLITTLPSDTNFVKSENKFVNPEAKGGVKLEKYESESGAEGANPIGGLNDVTFELFKENGNTRVPVMNPATNGTEFITATVGEDKGIILIDGLEWGDYVFVEKVPDDYVGVKAEYKFSIDAETFKKPEKIEVVTAVNERKPGSLLVEKLFENTDEEFDGTGVQFTLKLVEGTCDTQKSLTKQATTVRDPKTKKFTVTFKDLPWGIYELYEGAPKEGFLPIEGKIKTVKIGNALASKDYAGTIDKSGLDVELLGDDGIINEKIKGSVKIQKVDSVHELPVVASFKLYKGAHPDATDTTTKDKAPVVIQGVTDAQGVFTTDENGYFAFPDKSLEYGEYYLEESVPLGYQGHKNGEFTYQGTFFNIVDESQVQLTKDYNNAIPNTPDKGRIYIKKEDNKGKALKGVTFTLYADDAQGAGALDLLLSALNFAKDEQGTVYATLVTNEKGEASINDLPWGTYHLVETVPEGFTISDEQKAELEKPFYIGAVNKELHLEYKFEQVINDRVKGSVELEKYGQDKVLNKTDLLAGAKFDLYVVNGVMDQTPGVAAGGDRADTVYEADLVTSAAENMLGKIKVEGLEWGQYYFVETEPPYGFDLSTERPKLLTVGRPVDDSKTYIDVTTKMTEGYLAPSTTVTDTKGYGYTALYKVFQSYGSSVNTAVYNPADNTKLTFEIYAVDANKNVTGNPLEVSFGTTKGTEIPVDEKTLKTDVIGPLPYGWYAFVEKSIPTGVDYKADPTPKVFEISAKSTLANVKSDLAAASDPDHAFEYVTKFVNTAFRGWASIGKKDANNQANIPGIDFTLYEMKEDADGKLTRGSFVGKDTTDKDGMVTMNGLPLGKYAFFEDKESAEKLGFDATESAFVFEITEETARNGSRPNLYEATPNGDGTYSVTGTENVAFVPNDRIKGKIRLTKTGKDSKPLAGAVFNLWKMEGNRDPEPGKPAAGDTADVKIADATGKTNFETDANGQVLVEELEWGTYYFDEIVPPAGYTLLERPNHVEKQIGGSTVTKTVEVTMEDTPIRVDIRKTDITGTEELTGADLAIYPAPEAGKEVTGSPLITWTSEAGVHKSIEIGGDFGGLTASTAEAPVYYLLRETHAPEGYRITQDIIFSVDTKGAVTLYNTEEGKYVAKALSNAEVTVTTDNGGKRKVPLITVKDDSTVVKISKRELGTTRYLTGAELAIYDEANYQRLTSGQTGAVAVDSWTTLSTDVGGVRTITGKLKASNGEKHYYYLVERKVPAGYVKAEDVKFTVNNNNEIKLEGAAGDSSASVIDNTLVMYDRPIFVEINKKDRVEDKALAGAKLEVTGGKTDVIFTTTDKPALLVPVSESEAAEIGKKYEDLKAKYQLIYDVKLSLDETYTLTELEAPEGYEIAAPKTFKVSDSAVGIYEVTMLDTPIELFVSKKDLTGKAELTGAKMAIYEKNGDARGKQVISWISGGDPKQIGIRMVGNQGGILKRGQEYWLVEDAAPAGYSLAEEMSFTVNADGKIVTGETWLIDKDKETERKAPLLTMYDEPLAITVSKEDAEGRKLGKIDEHGNREGAKLELRTGLGDDGVVLASWVSDGKIAFISQHASVEEDDPTFTNVPLSEGAELDYRKTYWVVETEAPTGYLKAAPLEVKPVKVSEAKKDVNFYKVLDSRFGTTSKGGTKTWNLSPDLAKQLTAEGRKIKINLYRYYTVAEGTPIYIGKNGTKTDKEHAVVDSRAIAPSATTVSYLFDNLEKYYYSNNGKAYEYTYEVEEDLNGLGDVIRSKRNGDNFINEQRYTRIEGDKKWILFRDEDGKVLGSKALEELEEILRKLGYSDPAAYVNVNVILATISDDGIIKPVDFDEDGSADYYVTIKHGATDPSTSSMVEEHDLATEDKKDHITINWTQPGEVHFAFENLPMFDDDGKEYKYVFIEKPVIPEDADKRFTADFSNGQSYGTNGTVITNQPLYDPFNIEGKKLWEDPYEDKLDQRPTVTIQLYQDDKPMLGYRKTLTAADNYTFSFKKLYEFDFDQKKDGHRYKYELREEGSTGDYAVEIDFNGKKSVLASDGRLGAPTKGVSTETVVNNERVKDATVTNKIIPELINISGTKRWRNTDPSKVPEVTFNLYRLDKDASGKEVKTKLSSYTMLNASQNRYVFDNLPKYDDNGKLITYKVEEDLTNLGGYTSTPKDGYTITPSTTRGLIAYGGNDFENTPTYFRVRKTDMTTRRIIPGAVMRVIDKNGRTVDRWVTSYEDHYVEGLIYGETYTMEEVQAPEGYMKISPMTFTVDEKFLNTKDDTDPTIVEDPPIVGRVNLTKRDAATRETLSGAVFALYESDGTPVRVTGSGGTYTYSKDGGATTALAVNSAGALSVDELPCGSYYFRETTAPAGYELSTATESFTIYDNDETVEVTFLNERSKGAVFLRKTAMDGVTPLAGAVFELYSATPRTAGQAAASTIYSDAYYRYGTYTTGADGMIYVRDLPWDDYYFIEVEAPEGYVTNVDVTGDPLVYTFTIDSGTAAAISVDLGTITNDTPGEEGGGGGGGGVAGVTQPKKKSGVAGVRQKRPVSDVLGVRAKPSSGVLGARVGPVTGDAANIALWLLLLVASISMIVIICIQNHKKNKAAR